ncbi:Tyrosine-protein phosphatase [Cytospora mali]|uniref:Tyrosine-protein phosphatase n=1 Tax=Cytospora mali TaxID=578113 RepID=A0A194V517_CYTMA|nr:Tyrosine-protein phosphatase [Valsa mali var. pyri (nom. inval.)]
MASSNTPLPSPPFIEIPGLRNFRDCGGYPVASTDGKKKVIRSGIVFRASEPSMITDEGISILRDQLKITHVYDLRSKTEIERDTRNGGRQVKEWDGAQRVFVPVFLHEDSSPEAIAVRYAHFSSESSEGFVQVYSRILEAGASPNGSQPFAVILRHLASPTGPPTALLTHCTAGKDRTGVICALILSLCGVPDEAVAHEYSLTDLGLKERKEEFISHLIREEPLKDDRAAAERMVSSKKESMIGTLNLIWEKYGGVEEFVRKECGLSDEEIEQIQRNLVVDVDEEQVPIVDWEEHRKLMP